MAFKLVCVHEFHDHHTGKMINRGQEILDYDHMAKLVEGNREHHFVKVAVVMEPDQWTWPPKTGGKLGKEA